MAAVTFVSQQRGRVMARIGHDFPPRGLDFRIKIEECFDAGTQLRFDVFLAAFQHVHGDVGFAPIF